MEEPHSAFCLQTLDHQDPSVRIDGINRKLCLVCKLSSYTGGAAANSQMTLGQLRALMKDLWTGSMVWRIYFASLFLAKSQRGGRDSIGFV